MKGKAYRKSAGTYGRKPPRKTDWISWIFQALIGFFAGSLIYTYLDTKAIIAQNAGHPYIGAGLVGAGFFSIFGDRIWYEGLFKFDPVSNVKAGIMARLLSVALIITGAALIINCIVATP